MADGPPKYINYMKLAFTPVEFFLDLITLYPKVNEEEAKPGTTNGEVAGRFILDPIHAKQLMNIFVAHVTKYEAEHGEITVPEVTVKVLLN